MTFIDLKFLGLQRVVGTAVLGGPSGLALIDPGPTSCLAALESGLGDHGHRLEDVQTVLLTHIHLDHAGATGVLLSRVPTAVVYVHEKGAPHMADPTKLLASATRLYGAELVTWDAKARRRLQRIERDGYGTLPVCVAKTQYSFSTDPKSLGAPSGHELHVREVRLSAGAGFVVVVCGDMMTMPGLPRDPSASRIDLADDGTILGLS